MKAVEKGNGTKRIKEKVMRKQYASERMKLKTSKLLTRAN